MFIKSLKVIIIFICFSYHLEKMSTVKLKSKNIKDPKKLKYYIPFSFMVTTTICPELVQKLYGSTAKNNDTPASKKPSFVISNYEKYFPLEAMFLHAYPSFHHLHLHDLYTSECTAILPYNR